MNPILKPAREKSFAQKLADVFLGSDKANQDREALALLKIGLSGDKTALSDPRALSQVFEAAVSNKPSAGLVRLFNSGGSDIWTKQAERAASYPGTMRFVDVPEEVFRAGQKRAAQVGQPTKWDTFLDNQWIKKSSEMAKPDVTYVIE